MWVRCAAPRGSEPQRLNTKKELPHVDRLPRLACSDPRLTRLIAIYETLAPATLGALEALFAPQARFVDPFNDVSGPAAIRRVFEHMFETVDAPRFEVLDAAIGAGGGAFLLWNFHFQSRDKQRTPRCIQGTSHLRFDEQGRVLLHQDHWDPARQLYEGVPLLGGLLRRLREHLAAR